MARSRQLLLLTAILLAVSGVYANHFQNTFHFDDSHTVLDNSSIRSLHNLPRFFTDTTTFSVLPANRTYRPFVSASLAVDYALGHGYKPFWFHLSTFVVFLLQLVAMYVVYAAVLQTARPATEATNTNRYVALLATAWYGLHPVMAETVNYIIQRGDIFCTFGVLAAMAIYVRLPALRRTGLYLLPLAFALLSKPPAVVFPLLLFLYLAMFERQGKGGYGKAALATLPSVAVCCLLMALQSAMTPKTFAPSILSASSYRITQPFVLMRYFGLLFLPVHLNVDTDLQPFDSLGATALSGFLFVAVLLAVAWITARKRILRPISFGVLWFLIASLPTSLYRLSEVENDHRMFLPFVGLVLAVVWAAYLIVERAAAGKSRIAILRAASVIAVLLLALYACGAHVRNQVWRTDESLWLDDVEKSPHNARGLMNYGLTQIGKGKYPAALDAYQRALVYAPNYWSLEINLGIVLGAMDRAAEAEQHFQRAIALAPADDQAHFFYGRWLYQNGRIFDAIRELEIAVRLNPARLPSCNLLAAAYSATGDADKARSTAELALGIDPTDSAAKSILSQPMTKNADYWINVSLVQYRGGHYEACIEAAKQALQLNPNSELAYNNIGAGYAGLKKWDLAINNERAALRIKPDFVLARNNLAAYSNAKAGKTLPATANVTAEDWLNASLRDNLAGLYQRSIDDARSIATSSELC